MNVFAAVELYVLAGEGGGVFVGADRETLRQGVHISRKMAEAYAWKGIIKSEKYPGADIKSDADLDQYIADSIHSANALVGTCAMGDPKKVCIPTASRCLKIQGNLRCSFLTRVMSGAQECGGAGGGGEPGEPQSARRGGPARCGLVRDPSHPWRADGRANGDGGGACRCPHRLLSGRRRRLPRSPRGGARHGLGAPCMLHVTVTEQALH